MADFPLYQTIFFCLKPLLVKLVEEGDPVESVVSRHGLAKRSVFDEDYVFELPLFLLELPICKVIKFGSKVLLHKEHKRLEGLASCLLLGFLLLPWQTETLLCQCLQRTEKERGKRYRGTLLALVHQ